MKKAVIGLLLAIAFQSCETKVEVTNVQQTNDDTSQNITYKEKFNSLKVVTTSESNTERFVASQLNDFKAKRQALETEVMVFVNPKHQFQTFIGIGGAITDASAEVFAKLPEDKQEELIEAYYDDEKGIGYTLARTTIHSCDFSPASYTYVEEGDEDLSTFNIDHDKEFRIPMIKRATEKAGGELLLYASPWSPPAYMKDSKNMLQGGKLLPEYYDLWAQYYAKFIKAYEAEGMPIWGITIQNEPMATQRWESCIYTAEEERDFLKNHLGPTLEREGLGDKNVVVWDHNRDLVTNRANTIFDDPEASKYAWGIGFHWYEPWTGGEPMFENLKRIQESFPDKKLLFTEGCQERFDESDYQGWKKAERYGRAMINDFNQGTVGWTDWNILLDHTGGPNHVMNLCFSPIHADLRTNELIYTPSYYYIGHFSKFIKPGARRVSCVSSRSALEATSFINTDGSIASVVMNAGEEAIDYNLYINEQMISLNIPAHGMQSLILRD